MSHPEKPVAVTLSLARTHIARADALIAQARGVMAEFRRLRQRLDIPEEPTSDLAPELPRPVDPQALREAFPQIWPDLMPQVQSPSTHEASFRLRPQELVKRI